MSSTVDDLAAHREVARDVCLSLEFFPVMMEHQSHGSRNALKLSLDLVDRADVYIVLVGWRYGELGDGQQYSYTHLEYRRALERGIPILGFLASEKHPVLPDHFDDDGKKRIREFREQVRRNKVVHFFSSPEELRFELFQELSQLKHTQLAEKPVSEQVEGPVAPAEPEPEAPRPPAIPIQLHPAPTATKFKVGITALIVAVVVTIAIVITAVNRPWWRTTPTSSPTSAAATSASVSPPASLGSTRPAVDPAWLTGPAAPGITIVFPADGQTTKTCVDVRGTAQGLAAGKTVLIAVRKQSAFDGDPFYLYEIADPTDPAAVRTWRANGVSLGNGQWQDYDLYALIADRASVEEAMNEFDGTLTSQAAITGLRRGAHVQVHQSGAC